MILGYSAWGDGGNNFLSNYYTIDNFYRLDLTKSEIERLKIDETTSIPITNTKEEWGYDTTFLLDIEKNGETLESGNINNNGIEIQYLRLKRRKQNELKWYKLKDFPFDKTQLIYEYIDKNIESGESFEYAIMPVCENVEGQLINTSIISDYDCLFISDKDTSFKLEFDLSYGDIEYVGGYTEVETLGSQYPFIVEDGLNYRKGQIKAKIVSDVTIDNCGNIDKKAEREARKMITEALNNRKVKLLKDGTGNFFLVKINSIKLSPINELQQLIYDISFNWTEVEDAEDFNNFIKLGLV